MEFSRLWIHSGKRKKVMPKQMSIESRGPKLSMPVSEKRDHILGPPTAGVTLVEYGDYQCPYCGKAYGVLKKLLKQAGDSVRLVFRNFPLTQIHPYAHHAAEAAEAAALQGKFWEMHDMLYENQESLEDNDLLSYAKQVDLNIKKFEAALEGNDLSRRIQEDFLSGVRSGVNGTPTFFINDVRHDGAWDLDSLMEAIGQTARPTAGRKRAR
jgi:protein-disulfide isomerase